MRVRSKQNHQEQRLDADHSLHFCNIPDMLVLKHLEMISWLHMINTVELPLMQTSPWRVYEGTVVWKCLLKQNLLKACW